MKIELKNKKVFFLYQGSKKEIHPFWLRERVNGENFVDKRTQQRLFDPTQLKENIEIDNLDLSKDFLEITFSDGTYAKLIIKNILDEFSNNSNVNHINKVKWNSSFKNFNNFQYKDDLFEDQEMYKALVNFYKYGFVIFNKVPTKNNFIVNFAH